MEPNIPDDIISSIEEDVRKLIQSLTPYEPSDEHFKQCVDFTMYHVLCEKHSIPSQIKTEETLEKFIVRYDYEGFTSFAEAFKAALVTYVETDLNKNPSNKMEWCVLECLLELSNDVFKTDVLKQLKERLSICDGVTLPDEFPEEEKIDWYAYLQEGSEKYRLPSDDEDEHSSYDSDTLANNTIKETSKHEGNLVSQFNNIFDHFPQRNAEVPDKTANLKQIFIDDYESKKWLLSNVQHSWWNGEPHEIDVDIHYPAATFGLRWEQLSPNIENKQIQFLEEYKIIRELLWIYATDGKNVDRRIEYLQKKVSVLSLIQHTTRLLIDDILDSAKKYFALLGYYNEVLLKESVIQIPFSYQAYASVLKDLCLSVLHKILEEEDIVKKQDTTYMLLTLHTNLRPYLNEVNFVYEVHEDCILSNWAEEESWLCTVRFLSMVFNKIETTESARNRQILLRIFFKTFKVYADMIDSWLTESKLYDWKNEFFIRKDESSGLYKCFPLNHVIDQSEITIAPFFDRISKILLKCSENVEFLCKLNKMQCVRSAILKDGTLIESIINSFTQRLYRPRGTNCDVIEAVTKCEDNDTRSIVQNEGFLQQDVTSNLYLLQAYNVSCTEKIENRPQQFSIGESDWEKTLTDLDLLPVASALEQTICTLIESREATIADFFKLAIVDNYKFFDHIRTLSELLLMDMRPFCNQINMRMDKKTWSGIHLMKILLYDCVRSNKLPFDDLVHFTFDKNTVFDCDSAVCVSEIIQMIDFFSLQYRAQWPMSKIFTSDIIEKVYDPLFKLVLKINVAFFSVTRLQFKDLPETRLWRGKLRRLQMFRHWVILLLQKLRSYMLFIVPQCLGDKLIENIREINNFTSLQETYSIYLEEVKPKCLIDSKMEYLNRALERIWRVCDDVHDLWSKAMKFQLTEQDVIRSVELFVQCLWYLSQVLKKIAKGKHPNDPLSNLWLEVHHMVEMHEQNIPEDMSLKSSQSVLLLS